MARRLQRWQPYAGLVYFHLLLDGLAQAGYLSEEETMTQQFKIGDHVQWNSEAGRVRGTIKKKFVSETQFKGYTRHASNDEPQYLIKSDKTDHLAMHKASALKKIRSTSKRSPRRKKSSR